MGENGAGKTTLVKLLMGLYRPTSGRIVVDGNDLDEIALNDWYTNLGPSSSPSFVTRRRPGNITFGWLEGVNDEARLETVLTRSGAQEAVTALPRGLDTPLGKEFHAGAELSVGQWQKLAIARAYFRPAEILILDEPASALDANAEAAVYRHFADHDTREHAILISHRLASCQIADRILVLREGRLIEQGHTPHCCPLMASMPNCIGSRRPRIASTHDNDRSSPSSLSLARGPAATNDVAQGLHGLGKCIIKQRHLSQWLIGFLYCVN